MAYLGEKIGKLGFGLMRLPKNGEIIDIEQTKEMVDLFMDAGFTYFDTAWAYEGSENAIRQALVERYPRESYQLATKNAAWINCKTKEEAVSQFDTSLRRQAPVISTSICFIIWEREEVIFLMIFSCGTGYRKKKKEGLVKHAGFSFHSNPQELDEILTAHPEMEFVQLQINYADWDNPAIQSKECYEVARRHGKPVIIMEPVKGGMLATPPDTVKDILKRAEPDSSVASWAVRFAADLDGIITVLSGMSNKEQMNDNISFMKDFKGFDDSQRNTIKKAQEALSKIPLIPCTTCDYCAKVCPANIGISGSFTAANYLTLYGDKDAARHQEEWLVKNHGKKQADQCIKCGKCEEACPQHIRIRENLDKVTNECSDRCKIMKIRQINLAFEHS